jgi:ATP-binding cassette subfamily B protein
MENNEIKSGGLKGALKVYKVLYNTDKLVIILQFPTAILRAIKPYIALFATAYILDGFITGQAYNKLIYIALGAVILSFMLGIIENYMIKIQQSHNDVCIRKIYMAKAEKYLFMDYQLLESSTVNAINSRIAWHTSWGGGFDSLPNHLRGLLDSFFGFIIGIVMLIPFFMNNRIDSLSIILVILFIFSIIMSFFNKKIVKKRQEHLCNPDPKYIQKRSAYFIYQISISSILKTARIYGLKQLLGQYINEGSASARKQKNTAAAHASEYTWIFTKYSCASGLISGVTSSIFTVTAYLFIVAKAVVGTISVSNVIWYAGTIYNLANSFFGLSSAILSLVDQTDRVQSMLEFMEVENVLYRGMLPIEKLEHNQYVIEFHNVSFKYPGSDNYSLRKFSIKINVGQKLAIVGMNGSGKTTMIKLLCRLYDPSEGMITLNGIDIKEYDYNEYMKIFSVVFQDFKMFSLKLSENIACSLDIDTERVKKVIDMVGLSERTKDMKESFSTYLYNDFDSGVEISGGEAQKIALARALYKNAPIVILDEPTAALDPIAEFEVYSKFNEIIGDKTAIYISHRLSSCRFCDDIAVFHNGELIQRGNHNTLLTIKDGKYFELWNAQAQYYNDKTEGDNYDE